MEGTRPECRGGTFNIPVRFTAHCSVPRNGRERGARGRRSHIVQKEVLITQGDGSKGMGGRGGLASIFNHQGSGGRGGGTSLSTRSIEERDAAGKNIKGK